MTARSNASPLLRAIFSGREHDDTRLHSVLEQLPAATLLAVQKSGAILAVNSRVAALTGWPREEILRFFLAEVIAAPAAATALEAVHGLEPSHIRQVFDVPLRTRAGRPALVDLRLAAFSEPGRTEVLILIQATPADERAAQEQEAAHQAQALDSFEQLIKLLAVPDETALALAIDLTRDMLAADAAGLYQVAPDQPGMRLYTPAAAPRVFPLTLGPSEAQYLQAPQRWSASQRPAGFLQQAARTAGWGTLLSHPVGNSPGIVGVLCVAYRPGAVVPSEAQRLLLIAASYIHQLTTQIGREAGFSRARDLALRLSGQLTAISAQVEEGVILLNRDGTVDEINGAAAQMLGYRSSDVTGLPFGDVLIGDAALEGLVRRCLAGTAEAGMRECRLLRRGGDAYPAKVKLRALPQGGCLLTVRDGSQEQDQEIRREHLDQLAYLGEATHSFAHELRHPLNAISTGVQYLASRLTQSDDEVDRTLTTIQSECTRLSGMMNDMLSWAKPLRPRLEPISLEHVVRRLLNRYRSKIERRNVRLNLTIDDNLPQVLADARLLEQVFDNLVENAVQAMPAGGDLMVALTSSQRATGAVVEVRVGDSGPGIAEENRRRIFDPYFTTKPDGTGLGLAISKRLITLHHGAIGVDSFPGAGTVFTVTLPVHTGQSEEVDTP
jgi:PAS domain S-box-containing protein